MRSNLEFRSLELSEPQTNSNSPGGKAVAQLLAEQLPYHGFLVGGVEAEDWGWRIHLSNEEFPLWVGCGAYQEYSGGCLCFIEPSKPFVRRWLKRIPTKTTVDRLADAVEGVLRESGKAHGLRWWSEAENAQG